MMKYRPIRYRSADNLELYARDYSPTSPRATVLCMPGLTRNSADFEFIGDYLSTDYRVVAVDQRGRGCSGWDPVAANYDPAVYVRDMFTLLDVLALTQVILLGTSLGGLMAILMASAQPSRIRAVILNDIGPEINPQGMARIQTYVGKQKAVTSWEEAVAQTRMLNAKEFPDLDESGWLSIAHALYRENAAGTPVLAYDPAIAPVVEKNQTVAALPNLWPQFEALVNTPMLLIRGALSDIISKACVDKMRTIKPDLHYCELANRGHAPLLNEPESLRAIDSFLKTL